MTPTRATKQSVALAVGCLALVAACSSGGHRATTTSARHAATTTPTTTPRPTSTRRRRTTVTTTTAAPPTTVPPTSSAPPPTAPPPPATAPPGTAAPAPVTTPGTWSPVHTSGAGTVMWLTTISADGVPFTVAKLDGSRVHLSVHAGGAIPGYALPTTVAAFNGGFSYDTGQSGYRDPGTQLGVFNNGMAAIVGYTDGRTVLGQWGRDVPAPGRTVSWARSNLTLLVDGGAPTPQAGNDGNWGTPLSSIGPNTARTALGVDASGNWLFAVATSTHSWSLAHAMVAAGAVRAMELDINPWWPLLYSFAAGHDTALYNNPNHPGTSPYVTGYDRDFFLAQVG